MPTLQNGQTHSNNSSAVADRLFECVWPFCGIGALRVKKVQIKQLTGETIEIYTGNNICNRNSKIGHNFGFL